MKKQLTVESSMSVKELEKQFALLFPFLRLEIYRKNELIKGELRKNTLQTFAKKKNAEKFVILPEMVVSTLETTFREKMGLKIAIFRKVGNILLETSFTSGWTLRHQNTKGSELLDDFAN